MENRKLDIVVSGYVFHDNKVLLIKHKKLNKWLPPGGHIDENESPDDAIIRELKEETNLDIRLVNYSGAPIMGSIKKKLSIPFDVNIHDVGDHDHCCLFYLCVADDISNLQPNLDEIDEAIFIGKNDVLQHNMEKSIKVQTIYAFDTFYKTKLLSP